MMHITDGLPLLIFIMHFKDMRQTQIQPVMEISALEPHSALHPYFDFDVLRNVTARVGQTAFLHCRVEDLGDKSVSWIRKRDLHILTAGISTYTSDGRFQVMRPENSENWTLQIKFPQLRDTGIYECQVNTEPKMSMAFRLNVVDAKANIIGPSDLYVKMGSKVSLQCVVRQGPHELGTVFWYRGQTLLEPKTLYHPNEAFHDSDRLFVETSWLNTLMSRLTISSVKLSDSGNYSCIPTTAEGASVIVHVINGEHPAAMQRGCANTIKIKLLALFLSLFTIEIYSVFSSLCIDILLGYTIYVR